MASATARKSDTGMKRVKMLTSQSGFTELKRLVKGREETHLGPQFVRDINKEYEMPTAEADRLIAANQAVEVEPSAANAA